MERNPGNENRQDDMQEDKQLQRLAGQMRDTGVAPDRDLWPGINAAINEKETEPAADARRPKPANPWRLAAVAAALVLMLAAGWVGIGTISGDRIVPDVVEDSGDRKGGLAVIDRALDELNLALANDPENRNLTQLVLMVHKTRGDLLLRNSDNLLRD